MTTPRTILVIASSGEDDVAYQEQLQQDSTINYKILLGSMDPYLPILSQSTSKLDGILLDLESSQTKSLELLRQLKEQTDAPVIVVDRGDTEFAVQAFKHGADDYLVKDRVTPADLRLAMRTAMENAELKRKLKQSQETFFTSIENMLDCFGIFSAMRDESGQILDFRIDYLNAAACENNQMPKEMQIGRGLCEILPAHRDSGLFDDYCRLVNTGEPLIKESLVYEDVFVGRRLIRAFDIRASKLNDGFVASWRDVTKRKQTELELSQTVADLRASQQYNRDWAEAMPQIVWTADSTGAVNYWNQAWYDYTGLSEAVSLDMGGIITVHPEERDLVLEQWYYAVNHGEPFEIEYRIQNREGKYHWFICRSTPTRNSQGEITGWIGTITDIDQQKQTALALQKNQERLDLAMKAARMGSWDWNIQTGEVHWSKNLEDLFGMAPGSFDGRYETVLAMIHPEDLPRVEQAIHSDLYNREPYNIEFRFIKPDGNERWALGLGRVFYDNTGNPVMMTGVDRDITESKQAEIALRNSERRYRSLVEATTDIIWNTEGNQGKFTTEQPSWSAFTGQTWDEFKDWGWLNAVHPDDQKKARDACMTALETGKLSKLEYRLRRQDGVYRQMQVQALPIFEENGRILEWLGVHIDISDSNQAEGAIAKYESRLQGFVEANVVGILYGDIYGNIYSANDEVLRIIGYTQDDVRSKCLDWIDLTPSEYLPLDEQGIAEARTHGACTPYEKEYIRKDGTRVPVLIGYSLVGEAREETVVFVLDLSSRKQAELQLQDSEARLQLAMQVTGFTLVQIDYTTNTVNLSPEAAALYGLSPNQLIISREQLHDTFHPEDRAELEQHIEETLNPAGKGWFSQDHRILFNNGQMRWLTVRKQVFFDHSSSPPQPLYGILVALDITERKQAEIERFRLLQQEKAARAEAERVNRIKDAFLAILSHELRSPLNPILGWANLLQKRTFDAATTAQALATIERNAKLQTRLIDDLLDVSKILRGKLMMDMASVDLAQVIESAINTMRPTATAKSIQLHYILPQVGRIWGDSVRLQQIIWNLLSNAIKFTPRHGRVDILLERVDNQVQVIVSDTGKGIDPDFIPYLFESFRQENTSTTRKFGGLGLGLAIVRYLVEAHGGTIAAESPGEGQGATFTIQFPLMDIELQEEPSDPKLPQVFDLTNVRVLAIDDEPDARELLTNVLTMYGATVLTVTSATEVLTALESFQPDILISDIGMPDVDGYTLIEQIRALPPEQGGQIPAIALTAYARQENYQQAIASGFQQQVTKPMEPDQLLQAVTSLVHRLQ